MDYLSANEAYFKAFVSEENFGDYIHWKRQDAVWGDDVELQAISEIYNRPIEIFAYSTEPMRTFHEQKDNPDLIPIRLSYFGCNHYDSITPIDKEKFRNSLLESEPGMVEDQAINNESSPRLQNQKIRKAREIFDEQGKRDMEAALAECVEVSEKEKLE